MTTKSENATALLAEAYPLLFRNLEAASWSYLPAGWFGLVDRLCTEIQAALGPAGCGDFEVHEVKPKFGALRFYYRLAARDGAGTAARRVRELVDSACAASESTCERCGAPARHRNLNGYETTRCDKHAAPNK